MAKSVLAGITVVLVVLALFTGRQDDPVWPQTRIAGFSTTEVVPGPQILPDIQLPYERAAGRAYVSGLAPRESPDIVIVVALNEDFRRSYLKRLLEERVGYAETHNYGVFARYIQDFAPPSGDPLSPETIRSAQLMLTRQALEAFPHAKWLWYLDDHSRILNKSVELSWTTDIDNVMLKREPIVNTIDIRTSGKLPKSGISFVFSQTSEHGVNAKSMLLAVSNTAKAFVEYIADPINTHFVFFQPAPDPLAMLLGHLFAWHPYILWNTALVPSEMLGNPGDCKHGDFVCHFGSSTHWGELDKYMSS